MLVELVRANSLNQIFDSAFDFVVLAAELLAFDCDPNFLHLYEFVESVSLGFLWQIDEHCLGKSLKVVFNTVLHNVVDVDDELLEFGQTLMHVIQIAVDIHRSPGESYHTWAQLVLEILEMGHEE